MAWVRTLLVEYIFQLLKVINKVGKVIGNWFGNLLIISEMKMLRVGVIESKSRYSADIITQFEYL